jgi:hypothetical protein
MDKISYGCILIFLAVLGALMSLTNTLWLCLFGGVFLVASGLIFWGVFNGEYPKRYHLFPRKVR